MSKKSRHDVDSTIIEYIACGRSQTETARLVGVGLSTVRRRLETPEFRARIERFRAEMLDAAAGKLGAVIDKAVKTLEGLLCDATPPAVRLAAARSVVELTFRTREILGWEKRLADVEVRLNAGLQNVADE